MTTPAIDQKELFALPHGEEFRFIHQITALDPGSSARGQYTISGDEEFLRGHFPKHPIWPGVLMIEAIAQLGGIAAQSDPHEARLDHMRLTAIKNSKILGTAEPGATLMIEVKVEGRMGTLIQISGSVSTQGTNTKQLLAKGIVMLSGSPQ